MRTEIDLHYRAYKIKARVFTAPRMVTLLTAYRNYKIFDKLQSQNKTAEIINFMELKGF